MIRILRITAFAPTTRCSCFKKRHFLPFRELTEFFTTMATLILQTVLLLQLVTAGVGEDSTCATNIEVTSRIEPSCVESLSKEVEWDDLTSENRTCLQNAGIYKADWDKPDCLDELRDEVDFEDGYWEELTAEEHACLLRAGWTKEGWDCEARREDNLSWDELSPEMQRMWESRLWTEERWDSTNDPCSHVEEELLSRPEWFQPTLLDLNVPELDAMDLDFWSHLAEQGAGRDLKTRLVGGENGLKDGEPYMGVQNMGSYIRSVKASDSTFYLNFEEKVKEKETLTPVVGEVILNVLRNAVAKNQSMIDRGLWNPVWNTLDYDSGLDWGTFLGAKGTKTHMHYDSDVFNVLYVAQGRKRAIFIPNDERTAGRYNTTIDKNWDGGAAWTGINLLDPDREMEEHAVEFIVEAGQALIIPYLAWHAFENLESGVAYSLKVMD